MNSKIIISRKICESIIFCNDTDFISKRVLLKCLELAKIIDDQKWIKIFTNEVYGYKLDINGNLSEESLNCCKIMGRLYNMHANGKVKTEFNSQSIEQLQLSIEFYKNRLKSLTYSTLHNYFARNMNMWIKIKTNILSRIQTVIFKYVSDIYNTLPGNNLSDVFAEFMSKVASKLNKTCQKSLEKFESIISGLTSTNNEN